MKTLLKSLLLIAIVVAFILVTYSIAKALGNKPNRAAIQLKLQAPSLVNLAKTQYEAHDASKDIDVIVYRVQDTAQDLLIKCESAGAGFTSKDGTGFDGGCRVIANLRPQPDKAPAAPAQAPAAPAPAATPDAGTTTSTPDAGTK